MKLKKIFKSLMLCIVASCVISCAPTDNDNGGDNDLNDSIVVDGIEINDSFNELDVFPVETVPIEVSEIEPEEIKANSIYIEEIQALELEVTSINDELVYLVYQNFKDYFPENIDYVQLLKDVSIAAGCILVCVTLSYIGGPVGTYFGAVICSEFTGATLLIGAAIDATIAGIQAYKEGGDISYIIGHMINGVADGLKFAALFAPVSGAFAGIKALRAVKQLKKVPGFENITHKAARALFESMDEILNATKNLAKDASSKAIDAAFDTAKHLLPDTITREVFEKIFKNQGVITNLIKQFNPFNAAGKVIKALKNNFIDGVGDATKGALKSTLNKIQNHTIKHLDDITDSTVKQYIKNNMLDFVQLFGDKFNKEFLNDLLENTIQKGIVSKLANITDPTLYCKLAKDLNFKKFIDNAVTDPVNLLLMQLKFGSKNVSKFLNCKTLYNQLLSSNAISGDVIESLIQKLIKGQIKSVDELSALGTQVLKNFYNSKDIISQCLNNMGAGAKCQDLMDDITEYFFKTIKSTDNITENLYSKQVGDAIGTILKKKMNKAKIISEFGQEVYDDLLRHGNITLSALSTMKNNNALLKDLLEDILKGKNIAPDIVSKIVKGANMSSWGLTDDVIIDIYNSVAMVYKKTNPSAFDNFISGVANIRGKLGKQLAESKGIAIRNGKYAGKICPAPNNYIAKKYGDIMYSDCGFPIFDKYAASIIETSKLTGISDSDIRLVNMIHHGTTNTPAGYTWHHVEDGKTLILIPTDLHESYRHLGGATLILEGLKG